MPKDVNTSLLATKLKNKRGNRGLRELAKEIGGVSASTLSRIEQGKLPDLERFFKICKWLEVKPETFMNDVTNIELSEAEEKIQEKIAVHLRADKTLSKETAEALIKMINLAYNSETSKDVKNWDGDI